MLSRRHPSDIQDARLIAVLEKYVPSIIARSIVERARREAVSGPDVSWTDPNGLLDRLSVGVRLFAAPEQQSAILREITDLAVADQDDEPQSLRPEELAPASTMKPSSTRRLDEARARIDEARSRNDDARTRNEEPSSRRDAPPQSAPSSQGTGPLSRRGDLPASSRRGEYDPSHRAPLASSTGPTSSQRTPEPHRVPDAPPANRGVFTSGTIRHTAASPRVPADRPSQQTGATPVIPPPAGVPRTQTFGVMPRSATVSAPQQPASPDAPREITITLQTEHDVPRARQVAREICEALGTRALTQQRLVTIVSELGRNMVLYAGGGKITLRPPVNASRRVLVLAVDQGPGISNLSEIMSGKYKSRSGLGLGIVGTKRLADSFHIETGRHGTAVSVEVIV